MAGGSGTSTGAGPGAFRVGGAGCQERRPFFGTFRSGDLPAPDPDQAAALYEWAAGYLAAAGFEQYEISNWARPGCACRHNLHVWRNQPYLGLGAGAHSWYGGRRWANAGDPAAYIARLSDALASCLPRTWGGLRGGAAAVEIHEIDGKTEMSETMMMGLRLLQEGVSDARFRERFGVSLDDVYGAEIAAAIGEGLLEWAGTGDTRRLRLTQRGHLLGNRVFVRFVD